MKICYLGYAPSIHTQRWVTFFAKQGHDVILLTQRPGNIGGVEEIIYSKQKYFPKTATIQEAFIVKRLVKDIKPEILHAHFAPDSGWYGAISGFHPYVLTVWGSDIFHPRFTAKPRTIYALQKADLITGDSQALLDATTHLGANKNKTYLIQFGVNTDLFKPDVDNTFWKNKLGIDKEKVIFSPRSLCSIYNIDIVIKAFHSVYEKNKDIILIQKTYLQALEPSYEKYIKSLIKDLGITDKVRFVGTIDYNEIPGLYTLADVVVSIPSSDATPMSVLEAMACGSTVIVSDLPSLREWIQEGYNGFIVPPKDVTATSNAILRCIQDSSIHEVFSNRNRNISLERADHQKNMETMEKLYHKLLIHS